jgi:apolipoprotein N-acyltransferase
MNAALTAIATFIRTLAGWRQLLFALACGVISALGFVPFAFFPALLLGFAALVLLIDGTQFQARPILRAALVGWCFGFGQFVAGMYWVGYAFFVEPSEHLWQLPVGIAGLPALLALFTAAGTAAAARLWRPGPVRIVVLAIALALAEWLRGHLFSGFPWNLPGYGWAALPALFQSTSVVGVYGLSFLTILLGASLALLLDDRRHWLWPGTIVALFVVLWSLGSLRETLTVVDTVPGIRLRIVQPNIPQAEKYQRKYIYRNWERLLDLSVAPGKRPTHIIWPESAPPFVLAHSPEALDQITLLTSRGTVLITGAVRAEEKPDGTRRYFNSLYIFGRAGEVLGVYDKFHLVPFGEYLPLEPLLGALGLTKLVGIGSFAAGEGPRTFHLPGAPPVGPLVCYEIIFPAAVTAADERPGWLVNVSDDSWFGPWAGPRQHLVIARVRAIEEGLPVIRGTNTGISAVIDPLGRVRTSLALGRTGVLDAELPQRLPLTAYGRFGDVGFLFLLFLAGGVTLLIYRRN